MNTSQGDNNHTDSINEAGGVTYETVKRPLRQRVLYAIGAVIFGGAAFSAIAGGILEIFPVNDTAKAAIGLLCIIPAFWLAWRIFKVKETAVVIQSPPTPAQEQAAAEARRKEEELYDKWWFRYPMAGVLIVGAAYSANGHPNSLLIPGVLVIGAIILMRELLFLGIAIGAIWLLMSGIASMPVSAAIIIGAIIIAMAVKR